MLLVVAAQRVVGSRAATGHRELEALLRSPRRTSCCARSSSAPGRSTAQSAIVGRGERTGRGPKDGPLSLAPQDLLETRTRRRLAASSGCLVAGQFAEPPRHQVALTEVALKGAEAPQAAEDIQGKHPSSELKLRPPVTSEPIGHVR
jgi:hypothetical protein